MPPLLGWAPSPATSTPSQTNPGFASCSRGRSARSTARRQSSGRSPPRPAPLRLPRSQFALHGRLGGLDTRPLGVRRPVGGESAAPLLSDALGIAQEKGQPGALFVGELWRSVDDTPDVVGELGFRKSRGGLGRGLGPPALRGLAGGEAANGWIVGSQGRPLRLKGLRGPTTGVSIAPTEA